jgi:metal-dependent hydrolase (beta-lactamase superfamily II)
VSDGKVRDEIHLLLAAGLKTEVFPRADSHEEVQAIVSRLKAAGNDLETKLVIGGFTLDPIMHEDIEQLCETCMYYKVHRRYCELPELDVPVEPHWSCRLWRI